MNRWIETIDAYAFAEEELLFSSCDKILTDLVEHGVFRGTDRWEELLRIARESSG